MEMRAQKPSAGGKRNEANTGTHSLPTVTRKSREITHGRKKGSRTCLQENTAELGTWHDARGACLCVEPPTPSLVDHNPVW